MKPCFSSSCWIAGVTLNGYDSRSSFGSDADCEIAGEAIAAQMTRARGIAVDDILITVSLAGGRTSLVGRGAYKPVEKPRLSLRRRVARRAECTDLTVRRSIMSLGRRGPREQRLWIGADELPRSPGHPFYAQLSRLLSECDFDWYVEGLCEPFYADRTGRPSIPPGVYFRMLFVGYFEGIDSQRGIAWRCSDSLSIRKFLGLGTTDRAPNHSSLTVIRKRLSLEVHLEVFRFVVDMATKKKLLKGKSIAVDATLLEANAAMKPIVRRDTGENWKEYVRRLAEAEGIKEPNDDDLRRFDRRRKGK
ncbi:MAG: transposase, partial [Phycisphaerales bacterium JB041]